MRHRRPDTPLENLTESVWMRLVNRVAGVLTIPLLSFLLHMLVQVHDDNIRVTQQIVQHEQRIVRLEDWRNGRADSSYTNDTDELLTRASLPPIIR